MFMSLSGEVNEDMYNKVFEVYKTLRLAEVIEDDMLDIFLNTDGGEIYQGIAIYDLIQLIKRYIKVRVICSGYVASSGVTVLMAGDIKAAMSNSTIMIHYGEMSCNSMTEQKYNKKLVDFHIDLMYDNIYVARKTILRWHDGDHFFNTTRALDVGLIDEVI